MCTSRKHDWIETIDIFFAIRVVSLGSRVLDIIVKEEMFVENLSVGETSEVQFDIEVPKNIKFSGIGACLITRMHS